jgi:cytochrome oxidase Cu insertion factor (SCO1/SenC/PrrC family)
MEQIAEPAGMREADRGRVGRSGGRSAPRTLLLAGVGAVLVGVGIGAGLHFLMSGSRTLRAAVVNLRNGLYGDATWAPGQVLAPNITTLHDQTGSRFSLSSLRGHTVAIAFFDSHCHQECPLEGRQLAAAESSLPRTQRPDLVVVSVNPKDTPASAARAMREWGLAGVAPWHWLMGTHRQLAKVWAAYHIEVAPPVNGDIGHTEALYLLDRSGHERAGYLWPFASRFATYDMRALATRRVS